ncbi:transposase [Terrabacter sp. LjRoot27]|uniref:transposase n=1 Tax=Terrabacter sp. LjRoot27 TaxID=3342306 RepID=UPI003ECDF4F0
MTELPPGKGPDAPGQSVQSSKRHYDSGFRAYAVERAKAPDARLSVVSAELGVSASSLRRWVKAYDSASALAADAPPVPDPAPALAQARAPAVSTPVPVEAGWSGPARHEDSHVIAMIDAILEMFPGPGALPADHELDVAGPGEQRAAAAPGDRIPLHPGDDIFPALSKLLPVYRFPIILAALLGAIVVSRFVPTDYALRPTVVAVHVLALVVSFGAVLVIDWHGLLWLAGRRRLTESTRLAAGAGPLIWGGLAGLIASGALLHPDLGSPLTVTKLVLVLAVAWNGAAMSALRRRMAQLPAYVTPGNLPRRDWRLMMTATVVSQIGWWGAILIGFVNSST